MTELQQQGLRIIRKWVEAVVLDKRGRRVRSSMPRKLIARGDNRYGNSVLAIAMLTEPPWGDPAAPAVGPLRELALTLADAWADFLIDFRRKTDFAPTFNQRTLAQSFELLWPHASAARRRRWHRAASDSMELSAEFLSARRDAWGKPGPYTGCGPNHLFMIAAAGYRLARFLDDRTAERLMRDCLRRHAKLQAPAGYFPEDTGPAPGYHGASLSGLCDYLSASRDDEVRPQVRAGVDFMLRAKYPDLTNIETIDQRNRRGGRLGRLGGGGGASALCFAHTPAGRRYAKLSLDVMEAHVDADPESVNFGEMGELSRGIFADPGGRSAKRIPTERDAYVDRFDGLAGVVRSGPWCLVLSAYHEGNRPGNPYLLDRTSNISLWHERAGLVVGGGNDKFHFDAATFDICEGDRVHYFPPLGGRAVLRADGGRVDLDYGSAAARLAARIASSNRVDLTAGAATNYAEQQNLFNLQIPVMAGTEARIDGKRVELVLNGGQQRWPIKKSLELAGLVRFEPTGGGEFRWPHFAHDTYSNPPAPEGAGGEVGLLSMTLAGQDIAERTCRVTFIG